jgi:hypothetical protein
MIDASDIPSAVCINCGSDHFLAVVSFDTETYEIASWSLQGQCYNCGCNVKLPCPVDHPEHQI